MDKKPEMHIKMGGKTYDWEGSFSSRPSADSAARGLKVRHQSAKVLKGEGKKPYHLYTHAGK